RLHASALSLDGLPVHSGMDQYKRTLARLKERPGFDHAALIEHLGKLIEQGLQQEQVRTQATTKHRHSGVSGDLDFRNGKRTKFPEGLVHVRGFVNMDRSSLTELPATLTRIDGYLNLKESQVTALPPQLTYVGGDLNLAWTR